MRTFALAIATLLPLGACTDDPEPIEPEPSKSSEPAAVEPKMPASAKEPKMRASFCSADKLASFSSRRNDAMRSSVFKDSSASISLTAG